MYLTILYSRLKYLESNLPSSRLEWLSMPIKYLPPCLIDPEGEADYNVLNNFTQQIKVFRAKFAFKLPWMIEHAYEVLAPCLHRPRRRSRLQCAYQFGATDWSIWSQICLQASLNDLACLWSPACLGPEGEADYSVLTILCNILKYWKSNLPSTALNDWRPGPPACTGPEGEAAGWGTRQGRRQEIRWRGKVSPIQK